MDEWELIWNDVWYYTIIIKKCVKFADFINYNDQKSVAEILQNFFTHLISLSSTGAIFEKGTDEIQSAFKFAVYNHNLNVSARRFELQAFVDVINTADAYKLSHISKLSETSIHFPFDWNTIEMEMKM